MKEIDVRADIIEDCPKFLIQFRSNPFGPDINFEKVNLAKDKAILLDASV